MSIIMANVKSITLGGVSVKKIEDTNGNVLWEEVPVVSLDYIRISGSYKTRLHTGDAFVFGGTVRAYYTDGTNAVVTSSATFSGYDMSTAGTYTVTVSYTEDGVTRTTSYSLVVADITTATINITVGASQDITTTQYYNRIVLPSLSTIKSKVASKTGISSSSITITDVQLDCSKLYWFPDASGKKPYFSLSTSSPSYFGAGTTTTGTSRTSWSSSKLSIKSYLTSSTVQLYGYSYSYTYAPHTYTAFQTSSGYTPSFTNSSGSGKPTFTLVVTYEY